MINTNKQILKGTLFAIIAGVMWGISGIFGQLFFRDYQGDPLWITSTRLTVAGILLLGLAFVRNQKHLFEVWKTPKNIPLLLFYAIGGVFSVQYFYYLAIELANSATATILQYVAPVFVMLYLLIFKKQVPSLKSVIYVSFAMFGVFLLITGGNVSRLSVSPLALGAGLLSAVAVVVYAIAPRPLLHRYGSLTMTGWGMLIAGVGSNILHPVWQPGFRLDLLSFFYVATISVVGTAIAFLLLLRAYQLISPLVVTVSTASEPLTAVFVSVFAFELRLTGLSVTAIILVIVSVILLSRSE